MVKKTICRMVAPKKWFFSVKNIRKKKVEKNPVRVIIELLETITHERSFLYSVAGIMAG